MIISGLQTGNTRWLAAHLQSAADNEVIDVAEVTGTIAIDIDGALAEFDAITSGTRATEGVYAAFINPPEPLTRDQYMQAIAHIEDRLGLARQPRIVLFHAKKGREHCHIVWSRIDATCMKAIHLSHDRQKLRRCARELAAQFGLELPPNLASDRGVARFDAPPQPTRAEKAMEAASGLSREERRRLITECYRLTDSPQAFVNSLEAAGFMLARGDKRVFVVVDTGGDVHSLARQIDGAKAKDVKKKLAGLTLSLLPPVDRAKTLMLRRAAARRDAARAGKEKRAAVEEAFERLQEVQCKRRLALDLLRQQMLIRHWHERKVLLAHIEAEKKRKIARRHWLAVGLAIYLKKIAFIRQLIEYYARRRRRSMEEQHRALMESVKRRHENEKAELRRRYRALQRLERREAQTFMRSFGVPSRTALKAFERIEMTPVTGQVQQAYDRQWQAFKETADDLTVLTLPDSYIGHNGAVVSFTELATLPIADPFAPVAAEATGKMSGYSSCWTPFRQNAVDITALPVTIQLATDAAAGGLASQPVLSAWPGAG